MIDPPPRAWRSPPEGCLKIHPHFFFSVHLSTAPSAEGHIHPPVRTPRCACQPLLVSIVVISTLEVELYYKGSYIVFSHRARILFVCIRMVFEASRNTPAPRGTTRRHDLGRSLRSIQLHRTRCALRSLVGCSLARSLGPWLSCHSLTPQRP